MTGMQNNDNLFADKEENGDENTDNPQEHTGTVFGSFLNEQGSGSSIGTGSSDQGIEPGEEGEEDEFLKDLPDDLPGDEFRDATNDAGGQSGNSGEPVGNLAGKYDTNSSSAGGSGTMDKGMGGKNNPKQGLVEEGPGPDA